MTSTEFLNELSVIAHKGQKAVVNGSVIEVGQIGRVNFATVSNAEIKGYPTSYFMNDISLLKDEFVLPTILVDGTEATLDELVSIAASSATEVLHTLSAEDLQNNPDLAEAGLSEGDEVVIEPAVKMETTLDIEFIAGEEIAEEPVVVETPAEVAVEEPVAEVAPENTTPIEEAPAEPVVEAPVEEVIEPVVEETAPEVPTEVVAEETPVVDEPEAPSQEI